jgi:hypothetical protein
MNRPEKNEGGCVGRWDEQPKEKNGERDRKTVFLTQPSWNVPHRPIQQHQPANGDRID